MLVLLFGFAAGRDQGLCCHHEPYRHRDFDADRHRIDARDDGSDPGAGGKPKVNHAAPLGRQLRRPGSFALCAKAVGRWLCPPFLSVAALTALVLPGLTLGIDPLPRACRCAYRVRNLYPCPTAGQHWLHRSGECQSCKPFADPTQGLDPVLQGEVGTDTGKRPGTGTSSVSPDCCNSTD